MHCYAAIWPKQDLTQCFDITCKRHIWFNYIYSTILNGSPSFTHYLSSCWEEAHLNKSCSLPFFLCNLSFSCLSTASQLFIFYEVLCLSFQLLPSLPLCLGVVEIKLEKRPSHHYCINKSYQSPNNGDLSESMLSFKASLIPLDFDGGSDHICCPGKINKMFYS